MKTKSILLILVLTVLVPAINAFSQKADLSGEWELNKQKTVLPDDQLFLSKITLLLKTDSLLTSRVYENSAGEQYPFDEKLSLDGKDCKIVIFDMPRTSKATRSETDGSIMIASATTFSGNNGEEDMVANETWKNEGDTLTLQFTNKMSGNEFTGTYYYSRVKK